MAQVSLELEPREPEEPVWADGDAEGLAVQLAELEAGVQAAGEEIAEELVQSAQVLDAAADSVGLTVRVL